MPQSRLAKSAQLTLACAVCFLLSNSSDNSEFKQSIQPIREMFARKPTFIIST